jgi:hypothetical protein
MVHFSLAYTSDQLNDQGAIGETLMTTANQLPGLAEYNFAVLGNDGPEFNVDVEEATADGLAGNAAGAILLLEGIVSQVALDTA